MYWLWPIAASRMVSSACHPAFMDYLAGIFVPTGNRRLNELIGFLMCVSALLLFLALVSYSPLDPSWNSASVLTGSHAARNWIGVVGAIPPMLLQFFGLGAFLLVVFPVMLGVRWFRSKKVQSPLAKSSRRNLAGHVRSSHARAAARDICAGCTSFRSKACLAESSAIS